VVVQQLRILISRLFRRNFSPNPMNISIRYVDTIKKRFLNHPEITIQMLRRNHPFITPEKMEITPSHLIPVSVRSQH
jgi:hypothetical protein